MSIHPSLIERAYNIYATFQEYFAVVPLYRFPSFPSTEATYINANILGDGTLKDIAKDNDKGKTGGGGGGGGTAKGLRIDKPSDRRSMR